MSRAYRRVGWRDGLAARLTRTAPDTSRTMAIRSMLPSSAPRGVRPARRGTAGAYDPSGYGEVVGTRIRQAWSLLHSGSVPELGYLISTLSAGLSRCTLEAHGVRGASPTGRLVGDSAADALATQIVADIAGGPAGQSEMLSRCAAGLSVAGRFYLVVIFTDTDTGRWLVCSDAEIKTDLRGRRQVRLPEGGWYDLDPAQDICERVWIPDPEVAAESSSLVLGSLGVLTEIELYGRVINARSRNALLSNGIVRLPVSLQVSVYDTPDVAVAGVAGDEPTLITRAADASDVAGLVMEQALAAADDPDSLGATMPIFVQDGASEQGRLEHIDITSGRHHTEDLVARRAEAIRRWAVVNNVETERFTGGLGDASHWSGWLLRDDHVRIHLEPLLTVICDALTRVIMRPLLAAAGHPDPAAVMIGYNTAGLTSKPDRGLDAREAYDRGVVSGTAVRHYSDFAGGDAHDLSTQDGQRDFALWLVARNETALSDPTIASWIGLPGPVALTSRSATSGVGEAPSGAKQQGPPSQDAIPASLAGYRSHRRTS